MLVGLSDVFHLPQLTVACDFPGIESMHCGQHKQWSCVMFSDEFRFSLLSDSRRTRTDLHVQSVTITGHIYRDVILEQHVRLFWGAMGAEFLFMDDNARPHHAIIVDECLQSEDITRMDWPAYSPDLNPVEHVWDMLGRRIAARQLPSTCLSELRRELLDEMCNIPQDQIDNLILSMPRRSLKYIQKYQIELGLFIESIFFNRLDVEIETFSLRLQFITVRKVRR
ncbi:transposable element Tc3 transposase [Trichonephila clavipes]|nr:transposable element Tc3 transposase [Trichonephila clavipes]